MEGILIEFVRNNEFLYNKMHKNHKSVALRDNAFAELSKKINVPARKLKARWRTLRDRFHKEMRIEPMSRRRKWKWLDNLMFLKKGNTLNSKTSEDFTTFNLNKLTPAPRRREKPRKYKLRKALPQAANTQSANMQSPNVHSANPQSENPQIVLPQSTTTQTKLSDEILDVMEDVMADVNNGISEVVKAAKDVLTTQTKRKTAAYLFFESLAKQIDDVKLSPTDFTHLQMEMLYTFNKFIMERQEIKDEI